jgi:hypothetical protein
LDWPFSAPPQDKRGKIKKEGKEIGATKSSRYGGSCWRVISLPFHLNRSSRTSIHFQYPRANMQTSIFFGVLCAAAVATQEGAWEVEDWGQSEVTVPDAAYG